MTVCGDEVLLTIGVEVSALVLPAGLAEAAAATLANRDYPVPVLVNPGAPDNRVLPTGELSGVPLPWPARVRLVTGTLRLPPSTTPFRPVRWQRCPTTADLVGYREIDVFGAAHTTLRATEHTQGGGA